jgi:hypothetical protein
MSTPTNFQGAARRAFGIRARIVGTGPFALVTRCGPCTQVLLFQDAEACARKEEEWKNTNCIAGSGTCCGYHITQQLDAPADTGFLSSVAPVNWERD